MQKIKSFQVDHDVLTPGLYVSRVDGDVVTYDLRMKWPNRGDYLSNESMHTIEHLLATYVRNSQWSAEVVYAGPMGCRTGFYLLLREAVSRQQALDLIRASFAFIADFGGDIPGAQQSVECGNYKEHDLAAAKRDAKAYLAVLTDWSEGRMDY